MEKLLMTFLLLLNDLKYGKSSLFCWNGYRHAFLKILFLWISCRYLWKALTIEKSEKKNFNDFFIAVLFYLYDLNSTKSRLSIQ